MRSAILFTLIFTLARMAGAQLMGPTAVPVGALPVVFLDGYQLGCIGDSSFKSNFGNADAVLQASNLVTVYFDKLGMCLTQVGPPARADLTPRSRAIPARYATQTSRTGACGADRGVRPHKR
jgi:hypothetical protein